MCGELGDGNDRTAAESKETQCQGRKLPGHFGLLLADWSEEDVQTWLCDEGLEELVGIFKANNTDGPELSQLNKETAAELGIDGGNQFRAGSEARTKPVP